MHCCPLTKFLSARVDVDLRRNPYAWCSSPNHLECQTLAGWNAEAGLSFCTEPARPRSREAPDSRVNDKQAFFHAVMLLTMGLLHSFHMLCLGQCDTASCLGIVHAACFAAGLAVPLTLVILPLSPVNRADHDNSASLIRPYTSDRSLSHYRTDRYFIPDRGVDGTIWLLCDIVHRCKNPS